MFLRTDPIVKKEKSTHIFSTQLLNFAEKNGLDKVKRWTKSFDIFQKKILIYPYNFKDWHWISVGN